MSHRPARWVRGGFRGGLALAEKDGQCRGREGREDQTPARRPEEWTPEEKLEAVLEAEGMADADLGLWRGREGLKEQHLLEWWPILTQRARAVFAPREVRSSAGGAKKTAETQVPLDGLACLEQKQESGHPGSVGPRGTWGRTRIHEARDPTPLAPEEG